MDGVGLVSLLDSIQVDIWILAGIAYVIYRFGKK